MSFLRIDRLATLYFFHPLNLLVGSFACKHIPILMYHSISNDEENNLHPYYKTCTSPAIFKEHISYLKKHNYTVVNLEDVTDIIKSETVNIGTTLDNKAEKFVVITFDDGFRDFYTEAFPILKKNGFSATVFLPTEFIGGDKKGITGKEHLSWDEVNDLSENGIIFGSHTVTHPKLKFLKREEVLNEIRYSKEIMEAKLQKSINLFSYPYAFPEENIKFKIFLKDSLQKCGYKYGVSTSIGTASKADDIFFYKRIPVNSCDDISLLKAKLEGGYNWLSVPQNIFKKVKKYYG